MGSKAPNPLFDPNAWVAPRLPIWLRVYEFIRRRMGLPRSLSYLNRELDANREKVHLLAEWNTKRLMANELPATAAPPPKGK